jgi:hypothetical protein
VLDLPHVAGRGAAHALQQERPYAVVLEAVVVVEEVGHHREGELTVSMAGGAQVPSSAASSGQ